MRKINLTLLQALLKSGLSQSQAAKKMGVSPSAVTQAVAKLPPPSPPIAPPKSLYPGQLNIVQEMQNISDRMNVILIEAQLEGDRRTAIRAAGEIRQQIILQHELLKILPNPCN